jgi:uncharacterized protein YcbX
MRPNIVGAQLGTVVAIRRYPVKSMQAELLDAAELHWTGLHGDRQYAFCRSADTSDFPWLTGRTVPSLVLHSARYSDGLDPTRARVRVVAPDGAENDIADPALAAKLAEAAAMPVRLLRLGRGAFDAMPVSVITTTTGDVIAREHGGPVGLDRFRANLVIRPDDPDATEREWLGRCLAFGDATDPPSLRLDWPIPRCAMVAIDPDTGARDTSVLRTVVQQFGNEVGAYCAVQAPGVIRVGDRVWS